MAAFLLLEGCVGLPRHVAKPRSEALPNPETTSLGRMMAREEPNKSLSGIRLLTSGEEALDDLIALADHAERTLDIQYYIIHEDESARTLLRHVRLAADRGVRVRVLVDDLNTAGEDRRFMHLSEHAHIEVRVFNPFPGGRFATWTRFLASATDIRRINHRMHNKLFVADNALAITGGRNIGDQYFTRDLHSNFIDLDVVAAGAIVPQLSQSFDAFWNSKYAYPIASVASPVSAEQALPAAPDSARPRSAPIGSARNWTRASVPLIWVPATVLADRPAKIASEASADEEVTIANDITHADADGESGAHRDFSLLRAGQGGRGADARTGGQGRAHPHTHQFPGIDRFAAGEHGLRTLPRSAAQARRRTVRGAAQARAEARPLSSVSAARIASLHAKALVIDQKTVFIGSMNMDARSARINSELGLVMRSAEIARQVTQPARRHQRRRQLQASIGGSHNQIKWISGEGESEKIWYTDPETTRLQRFWLKVLAPFAPEELL